MEVALYRGRGEYVVLVHASMRPPLLAEQEQGPLRYLDTVALDGAVLGDAWPAFADQISSRFYAVLGERDGLRLLRHRPGTSADHPDPAAGAA